MNQTWLQFAAGVFMLAAVLAWPMQRPGLAAALLTGYLVGLLLAQLLEAWAGPFPVRRDRRGAR